MPIIGVSGRCDNAAWSNNRAEFLENGGDDLVQHPVNVREIVASIRSCFRRSSGNLDPALRFSNGFDTLVINTNILMMELNGTRIALTNKEFQMLLAIAQSRSVVTKEILLSSLYGYDDDEPMIKIIDVFVCKLRKKMVAMSPTAGSFISTVWGRGYLWKGKKLEG